MNKSRFKKNFIFLFIILIVAVVVFFGYYFITGKKNPFVELVENISSENKINDNYNGVYVYKEDLNGSKFMFSGCSISYISNYILIMDEQYYMYRSSCMATFLLSKGKTDNLDIVEDEINNTYAINYGGYVYNKDDSVLDIVPSLNTTELSKLQPSTYQLLLKETQIEGNYYSFNDVGISGLNRIKFNFEPSADGSFYYLYFNVPGSFDETVVYSDTISDLDYLPDFFVFGDNLLLIEKKVNVEQNKYSYKLKVVNSNGVVYNSDEKFPITIDNVLLSGDNSVYIKFDYSSRNFKMIVGNDMKFCTDNYTEEEKEDIAYYVFTIDYIYNESNLSKPKFDRFVYKKEGCSYLNRLMEG